MIKAIIFDFDGVIAESVDIKTKAFAKLFEQEGEEIVKRVVDYHLSNTGVSRYEKFKHIYKEMLKKTLTEVEFQGLCNKFKNIVVDSVVKAPFVRGAKEFLENYVSKYKFFIASATPQDEIEDIVTQKQLLRYFMGVYGAPKKKTDIAKEIISDNNLLPEEIVYIGDALSDYEAANTNSINFIARINNNEHIFDDIYCIKMENLVNLEDILESSF
ncbi:MAG: HAD family hydrolase [Candidatus Omnitrophica bacterium]|nr:HAD family hydrolase [Candidatus Omnitrophota bacterium]